MSYQKVMADGTVCRTGPNCRRHGGHVAASGISHMQDKISSLFSATNKDTFTATVGAEQLINSATTSSLEWGGKKPKWWKGYFKEAASDKDFPVEPKLIDVVDSP